MSQERNPLPLRDFPIHPSPMDSWDDPAESKTELIRLVARTVSTNLIEDLRLDKMSTSLRRLIGILMRPIRSVAGGINQVTKDFDDVPRHW